MWAFDQQSDWDYIESVSKIFEDEGATVYYVELIAPQSVRLKRNKPENRLNHKPSKRDLTFSEGLLLGDDKRYRVVSHEGDIKFKNYLRIDNSAREVALMIKNRFNL